MTAEEKAKAYDEALKRIKGFYQNYDNISNLVDVKRELEAIFPQLCESEDEKTRKRLIDFISNIKRISESERTSWAIRKDDAEMCDAFLSYLEKQKEQPKEELVYRLNGLMQEYIKEGKDEAEKEHRFKCYQLFWDSLEDTSYFEQKEQNSIENVIKSITKNKESAIKFLKSAGIMDDNGELTEMYRSEQKPSDWNYNDRIQYDSIKSGIEAFASTYSFNIESKLFPQLTKEQQQLWREEIEQAVIAGGEDGIELSRDNRYKENKTTEWNEKDESFYDSIMCEVVKEGMHPTPAQANWLKSLPERFNLQPKQEWSEEDELFLGVCKNALSKYERSDKWDANIISKWLETRLKSLRPQPHWKPSEEQMMALADTLEDMPEHYKPKCTLESLKRDLEKLM